MDVVREFGATQMNHPKRHPGSECVLVREICCGLCTKKQTYYTTLPPELRLCSPLLPGCITIVTKVVCATIMVLDGKECTISILIPVSCKKRGS